jgi:hypothetical protein
VKADTAVSKKSGYRNAHEGPIMVMNKKGGIS